MQSEGAHDGANRYAPEDSRRGYSSDDAQKNTDEQRIRNERTKNGICKAFLHSECKREDCPYLHDKKKAEVCRNFASQGSCSKHDKCDYRHEQEQFDPNKPCKSFKMTGTCTQGDKCPHKHKRTICKDYDRGFCIEGPRCRNHHDMRTACTDYLLGFCPKGPECGKAHPKLFFEFDEQFFEKMEPDMKILKCHKCHMIGHKSPDCDREKEFNIQTSSNPGMVWTGSSNPMSMMGPSSLNPGIRPPGQFGLGFPTGILPPPPPPTPPPRHLNPASNHTN